MQRRSMVINSKDNVAVLLEKALHGDLIQANGEDIVLRHDIDFGHKAAIRPLGTGDIVYKYGEEIGHMLEPVQAGGWIHNHNMGCRRGR